MNKRIENAIETLKAFRKNMIEDVNLLNIITLLEEIKEDEKTKILYVEVGNDLSNEEMDKFLRTVEKRYNNKLDMIIPMKDGRKQAQLEILR